MDYVWRAPFTTPIAAPTQENDSESIWSETGVGPDFAGWRNSEDANNASWGTEPPQKKIELVDASTQTNLFGEYPLRILF